MKKFGFIRKRRIEAFWFLVISFAIFGSIAHVMGPRNMLNTLMNTSHDLLINTVLYLMGINIITGALSKLLVEFGVVKLIEIAMKPLMKPLWNLPGVAALGALLSFLSDNPAVATLTKDANFRQYFKKFQLITFTNFGTAFGMGMIVLVFMASYGYAKEGFIGLLGAFIGSIVSTRLMQRFVLKSNPELDAPISEKVEAQTSDEPKADVITRFRNSFMDGGKTGVDLGFAIIPGVLIISSLVMILTFGAGENGYDGSPYQGVAFLPYAAGKLDFLLEWLFGFHHPELVAFPITSVGSVGAALGLVPTFIKEGIIDGNAIAVFSAMGMCWSGFLSTHTAILDALGFRSMTSKDIIAHTTGGLVAGISAHWIYVLICLI